MSAIRFEDAGGSVADARRHSALHSASHGVARVRAKFHEWRRRASDRAQLAALDDRMLADIGISRAEAEFLANRPFWRE
jgi:uncharacterized protein YjiS (DUF1127 family)